MESMAEDRVEQEESKGASRQSEAMSHQRSWRFAYEALTHVHAMRLFLFNPAMSVPLRCSSLRAYLQPTSPFSASPVVVCQWKSPGRSLHTLYVPMPFCLIDHSAPFSVQCHSDFIEVKLKLLPFGGSFLDGLSFLGFSHRGIPIKVDGIKTETQKRDEAPFCLASDVELLASEANVSFYCGSCSAKLTNGPLSRVVELPSMEWRELADHWFGSCCCPDGIKTKKLLGRFQELITPASGVCLVGSTTCIVHCDDLVIGAGEQNSQSSESQAEGTVVTEDVSKSGCVLVDVDDKVIANMVDQSCERVVTSGGPGGLGTQGSDGDACGSAVTSLEIEGDETSVESSRALDPKPLVSGEKGPAIGGEDQLMGEIVEQSHGCGTGCAGKHGGVAENGNEPPYTAADFKPLANGFMSASSAVCSSHNWAPVKCHSCSSCVGVKSEEEEGVQLFKCYVSTNESAGGPSDIFRYHTLARVFCNELLANTEENSSYRYVIRGANTKLPLLQLVLLNHESWNCSGSCLGEVNSLSDVRRAEPQQGNESPLVLDDDEDGDFMISSPECELLVGLGKEEFPPAFLEPVMKVMYCDISTFSIDEQRGVEEWAKKHQADDIYMLESEISALTKSLQTNERLFPESCAVFEQFRSSFLAR